MGYKTQAVIEKNPQAEQLRRRLVDEWQRAEDNDQEPLIIEEPSSPNRLAHLYVIWTDWSRLTMQERSEIIMDAFEEVRGPSEVLNVSVAMGLTPEEAKRMGIQWA